MIIFIYGQDRKLLKDALYFEVLNLSQKSKGDPFFIKNEDQKDILAILRQSLSGGSLFGSNVVVLENSTFGSEYKKEIEDLLNNLGIEKNKETFLIVSEAGSAKDLTAASKSLFNFLNSQPNKVINCEPLTGKKLTDWIIARAKDLGATIDSEAAEEMILVKGNDGTAIFQEISKVANYKGAGRITREDVADLVAGVADFNVFALVDSMATRNKNKSYELLYKALKLNNDPLQLLRPIIYQFRNLLMAKDYISRHGSAAGMEKALSLHPFVAQKTAKQCQLFESKDLNRLYARLADIDVGIKSGQTDPATAFNNFILNL